MNFVDSNITVLIHTYAISLYEYTANKKDTDQILTTPPFFKLKILDCDWNEHFTDKGLASLPHLTTLDCGVNHNFTD